MQLDHYVHTLGHALRRRFGERIHKLPISAGFTCPNRDGTLGRGGCSFCNVVSFSDEAGDPVAAQIARQRGRLDRARRYLAYFQAYTNTYAEVATLDAMYRQALAEADIVGLCVGTRPDCVPDAVLDLLAGYRDQGYAVWLELGLQSAHDETLARVRRGHGWAAYADAVARARRRGIAVCTHLIAGLPGEPLEASLTTLERVLAQGCEGLKLHPLMVVRGSRLAAAWQRGEVVAPTLDAYADLACEMIRRTPAGVVFHRVSATARRPTLIAPAWCEARFDALHAIAARLARRGPQGSLAGDPWCLALPAVA